MRAQVALMAVALLGLMAGAARAQYPWGSMQGQTPPGAIAATGTATIKRPPAALRLYLELPGKGKTLEEALKNLKDRREAAGVQLDALKVDKDSIKLGNPTLSNVENAQRKQFEMMIARRMSSRGGKLPKGLKLPESFTVSATLTAEWPLTAKTPEEVLLAAHALQEKIKAADLAGAKEVQKLSPEEQEVMEEMAQAMRDQGEEQAQPGRPHFVFVARITPPEREKAMAEAFAKAKTQAVELAKAAGTELGPLLGIAGQGGGSISMPDDEMYGPRYRSYPSFARRMYQGGENSGETADEAAGAEPDGLTFTFNVLATFRLANAEKP